MCSHQESEDLWIMSECKHILCGDCRDGIEDELTEDGEMVKPLVQGPLFPLYLLYVIF